MMTHNKLSKVNLMGHSLGGISIHIYLRLPPQLISFITLIHNPQSLLTFSTRSVYTLRRESDINAIIILIIGII
jgi:triacylglycerol esterase/lipase EstA (alpha/beta hydrolase family)